MELNGGSLPPEKKDDPRVRHVCGAPMIGWYIPSPAFFALTLSIMDVLAMSSTILS